MLEELRIRGLGVIDEAVVELGPGLTVVSGETGAGKTMVLTGLGLLLGLKADAAFVRAGAPRAQVEGRLAVDPKGKPAARITDAGGDLDDDGHLVLTRQVSAEGRSRATAGGTSVPLAVLTEVGADCVAVHGQSDQQHLRRPAAQRQAVDRFAGDKHQAKLSEYRSTWSELREVDDELGSMAGDSALRAAERETLQRNLRAIESTEPLPGEDHDLNTEAARLGHVDALVQAAGAAHDDLAGADDGSDAASATSLIANARKQLDAQSSIDPLLAELHGRLAEAALVVDDVSMELSAYSSGLDADPKRLAYVEERRAELKALVRACLPHDADADIDAVLAWSKTAAQRLLELDDDGRATALRERRDALHQQLVASAAALTKARTKAAGQLSTAATTEIQALAMPKANLMVEVRKAEELGPYGGDDVEFLLASGPGVAPVPVHRGASGGELSRVMLALEVVLAGADPVPTFVFDEVDAGVGGRAAVEVGRRLARLANDSQVLVVTHLPQVAAFADHHFVVEKSDDGTVTSTGVREVTGDDRVGELARMLAGLDESDLGRAHAEELLQTSAAIRAKDLKQ